MDSFNKPGRSEPLPFGPIAVSYVCASGSCFTQVNVVPYLLHTDLRSLSSLRAAAFEQKACKYTDIIRRRWEGKIVVRVAVIGGCPQRRTNAMM